ncbi:MAG: COQ9 family protein [Alphaproteobacteria bacterium]|nr:COQ9 family protein [Alphaproteobacteria bacterium]
MDAKPERPAPSDIYRARLLDAMLKTVPEKGWTRAAFDAAAVKAGLSAGEATLACPNGFADLMNAFGAKAAKAAEAQLSGTAGGGLKVRDRVAAGVRAYLAALDPHKAAVRRAAGSPANLVTGPQAVWAAADAIWAAMGDTSTDANWYSKRLILSGVIASTLLVWLGTDDHAEIAAFLDRRIENVMEFEKNKKKAQDFLGGVPNPFEIPGAKLKPKS